ncbi:extracellular solute-binding protein [Endozoicomonas atrinae]|uniref:extracellular solute-binding protein n=1 Tax=Endozoicomonas atrinae TaxID=1333660 RepID=UPI0008270762|nr:extracellular solute-binding protein [Endozoicomonas atrinae]
MYKWLAIALIAFTPFAQAKEQIEFMVPSGDYMTFVTEVIKPEYERRYRDVELIVTNDGNLETRMAAGDSPNVYAGIFGYQVARYAKLGRLSYLDQYTGFDELNQRIDPLFMQENFGRHYYIPWHATTQMMIYNKDLFVEAGLDPEKPPVTWREFLATAEKISQLPARKNGNTVYGTVMWNDVLSTGSWYWNMLAQVYYNFNEGQHQLLNRYGTHPAFDREEAGMADFFAIMQQAQKYSPLTMEQNFFSRSIGMWLQYGFGWKANLQGAAGGPMQIGRDVGIAPIPVPEAGMPHYSNLDGRALMMFKGTREEEQHSWLLIQLLMESDINLIACKTLEQLPTLAALQNDPYFQQPGVKPFVDQLKHTVMNESFVNVSDVANIILKYYSKVVIKGEMEPESAVHQAGLEARALLKQ